jgi:hypothetical protein
MEEQVIHEEAPSDYGLFTVNTSLTSAELVVLETTEVSVGDTCDPKNVGNTTQIIQENLAHHELALPVIMEESECLVKSINGELVVSEDSKKVTGEKNRPVAQDVLQGSTEISVRSKDVLEALYSTNIFNEKEETNGIEDVSATSQSDLNNETILMNDPTIALLDMSQYSFMPSVVEVEELQTTPLSCIQASEIAQYTALSWPTNSINSEETGSTYIEKIKYTTGNTDEMEAFSQANQHKAFKQDDEIDAVLQNAALLIDKSEDVTETSPNNMTNDAAEARNFRESVERTKGYILRDRDVSRSEKSEGHKRSWSTFDYTSASDSDDSSTVSPRQPVRSPSMFSS